MDIFLLFLPVLTSLSLLLTLTFPCYVSDDTDTRAATEEFDELCFQFGIELDEDTTTAVEALKKKGGKEWEQVVAEGGEASEAQLKIEIPANR